MNLKDSRREHRAAAADAERLLTYELNLFSKDERSHARTNSVPNEGYWQHQRR